MSFCKRFNRKEALLVFLAVNLCIIWLLVYYPFSEPELGWFIQVSGEILLLCLSVLILYNYIIPRFLYRKLFLKFVSGIVLLVSVQTMVIVLGSRLLAGEPHEVTGVMAQQDVERLISTRLLWLMLALGFKLYRDQLETNRKLNDAVREKTLSDLESLKAQVAPEFLFNALNTIFSRIELNNQPARDTLTIFSDLMEYQLYDGQQDSVLLEREVAYLQKYISFYRIRMGNKIKVDFVCPVHIPSVAIHPLLFSPLIENAFKFVTQHEEKENFVKVNLAVERNTIRYEVVNTAVRISVAGESSGIGLQNLRKRLDMVYGERYDLETSFEDGIFSAVLLLRVVY